MTHTIARPLRPQLDPGRVAAETGTIAVNAVLLMLLLVPLSVPPPVPARNEDPGITIIEPVPVTPVVPIPVPVTRQPELRPRPVAQPVRSPRPVSQDPRPLAADRGEVPAVDIEAPQDSGDAIAPADGGDAGNDAPLTGGQLQYAAAPPPPYPREAIRGRLTGSVLLEVLVDVDGRPVRVDVARSSGHRVLDVAARRQVLAHWRFVPATRQGRAVQAIGLVPVDFLLER